MDEKLLQYVWQHQLFDTTNCLTTTGNKIKIISTGEKNTNSGPDFFNAKIIIDETLWVGCIEIHLKSSDWERHNHQKDKGYNNVILHVVFEHDKNIVLPNMQNLFTLELKSLIPTRIIQTYFAYLHSKESIPCKSQLINVDAFRLFSWLDRLMIDRLEDKVKSVSEIVQHNNQNQGEAFYVFLAYYFGFNINNLPFQLLATSIPLNFLAKQKNNLFQLEAMFFGQAGMLEDEFSDEYPQQLKKEYQFLKQKFSLERVCTKEMWKFAKTYPSGFPSIRIAQLAKLIHQSTFLLSKLLEAKKIEDIQGLFQVELDAYWETHYRFDVQSVKKSKKLGYMAINSLIINAVLPFMYYIGKLKESEDLKDKALQFYEKLPIEQNKIVKEFATAREDFSNALHSQALIQLKKKYCNSKQCLKCAIGLCILK